MGKQKGKTYPGKKPGAGSKNFAKASIPALRAAQKAAKAERKKVPEGDRVDAPVGLPAGWIAYRRKFQSGKFAEKGAIRFASADSKHVDISTVSQAIRKDAADKGYDPKSALDGHEKRQAEVNKKKEEPEAQKAGKLRSAVDAFREKHGRLDTATVANLPGWTLATRETKHGQKMYVYKGPNGESATQLVHVEAALGAAMLAGKVVDGLEGARAKAQTEKAKYVTKRKPKKSRRRSAKKDKMSVDEPQKKTAEPKKGAVKKKIKKT